jgi:aerobic C4-dicarboxylate transport protein
VLIGVLAGVALGFFHPSLGVDVKPLGDAFIKLIKMVFAPIIFAMVVLGIARMENMKELGRVSVRALVYFEVLSTFALGLGLLAVNLVGPGVGMNVDAATLDTKAIASYTASAAKPAGFVDFLLNMVPTSIVDALADRDGEVQPAAAGRSRSGLLRELRRARSDSAHGCQGVPCSGCARC